MRELAQKHIGMDPHFRYRGVEPGRLENFSDAIFALAITLLLISTSSPGNFEQIKRFMWDVIPFLCCISLIIMIWFEHFIFFYRYGLRHGKIVALNALFLTIVLIYVYPLKFLTKLILFPVGYLFGQDEIIQELGGMIRGEDMAPLMIIYGLGAMSVFGVLYLMYRSALKQADQLDLNELEKFDTRMSMRKNLLLGLIPMISVLMAALFIHQWFAGMVAGFTYFLYTPVMFIFGNRMEKKRKLFLEKMNLSEAQ